MFARGGPRRSRRNSYIYIYIYRYTYTHMYVSLSLSLYIYIYIHVYTYIYIYICVHIHVHTSLSLYIYIYIYMCISLSLSIYIYIYTHRDIYRSTRAPLARSSKSSLVALHYIKFIDIETRTPSPPTKSLDFRGFDSSRLLILRVGNYHIRRIW